MNKEKIKNLIRDYGDAIITYRSTESKKSKYNVCTLDFECKYIKSKVNRSEEEESNILLFCWDTNSYRLLVADNITSVVPLNEALEKASETGK